MDPRYAYLNAVLDDNPSVAALVLDSVRPAGGGTSIYAVATGPIPDGQQDIQQRATVAEMPAGSVPNLNMGFDGGGALVIQFFA